MTNRREALALTLSIAAMAALPRAAGAATTAAGTASERLAALLANFADEIMRLNPTQATSLGLDNGNYLALKSQLADAGPSGDAKWARQVDSMLKRLAAIDRETLLPAEQIRLDTVKHAANAAVAGTQFSFGGAASGFYGGTSPYVVSQQDGIRTSLPEFLASQHQINNAADAEAYLARVAAMARVLDQESARLTRDAARGVVPPNFIAKKALSQLQAYRAAPVDSQGLVRSIAERAEKLSLKGTWQSRASKLVATLVYPALDRQITAFTRSTANATDTAGVHGLPDGEAYYRWALQLGTTTHDSAADLHALGLEQNQAIQSRMHAILKSQGMTHGTVGERVLALTKDPKMLFANTDSGREELIAYCNERVTAIRALLPRMSHLGLSAPLVVKRVPPDIQDGASLGYMNFAALDGSRPAIYYINLKSTTLWPRYQLSTLTAHEGVPGHAWQGAYLAEHHSEMPLLTAMMGFNAFVEGWALYAEQLCDEFDLYASDPFSRIGYLQFQQFRACRLVVDTGIHAMRWTRDQAIRFLVENTGRGTDAMTSEVDRYCVSPGQACGYKIGHNQILELRERAKSALGARFDIAAFNDAIVTTGGVPLPVLTTAIDQFIARSAAQEAAIT